MAVPAKMSDLATLPASNSPQGSDAIGNSLDDFIRALSSIVRSTNALSSASIAAASTTDLGSSDAEQVAVSGAATITSFGTTAPGIKREVVFTSGGSILTNSTAIQLPNAANITVVAGDIFQFRSLGSGNWWMCAPRARISTADVNGLAAALAAYLPLAGGALTGALTSSSTANFTGSITSGGSITAGTTLTGASVTATTSGFDSGGTSAGFSFRERTNPTQRYTWFATGGSGFLNSDFFGPLLSVSYTTGAATTFGVWTGPNFIATSDRKKKKNIKKCVARQDIADRLKLVTFNWKKDGRADMGLIAQQVRDVAPEYVYTAEDGSLGLDKAMLALEAVIGLAARVRALEGK